jgi:2-polyprenyl-6-hydroxyphenyl methylase/3-demethylubiquinone-9 3-methyltransferase
MKKTLKWNIAQKAELRWWKHYLRGKDVAQYQTWKTAYWQNILHLISDNCLVKQDMLALDAGCGPAGIFMSLQNCKVHALDPLLDVYDQNLPHFKKSDYPHVQFFSKPLEEFRVQEVYDMVFCMNAINHVSDLGRCYDILTAAVKPGGKLVISIDAHNYRFFKWLFRLIPGDILHPHQFDRAEYARLLTERNFTILQQEKLKHEFFFNHYIQVAEKNGSLT